MDSAYFFGRSGGKKSFFRKFFSLFQNLDPLYRPVAGKPLVLEVLCFEVGTSVASALTAETIFEIMKCVSDVDMRGRVRKVAAAPCSETAGAKKLEKFTETCFVAHYYACKFGVNR